MPSGGSLTGFRRLQVFTLSFLSIFFFFNFHLPHFRPRLRGTQELSRARLIVNRTSNQDRETYQDGLTNIFTSSHFRQIIEKEYKQRSHVSSSSKKVAFLRATSAHFINLLKPLLENYGFIVHLVDSFCDSTPVPENPESCLFKEGRIREWILVICFTFIENYELSKVSCLNNSSESTASFSKLNWLPQLSSTLFDRSLFCRLSNHLSRAIPDFSPTSPCFVQPEDSVEFLDALDASPPDQEWQLRLKEESLCFTTRQLFHMIRSKELNWESSGDIIISKNTFNSTFSVSGYPVSLEIFVLITSLVPLRAYVHNRGHVSFHGSDKNVSSQIGKSWELGELWRYAESYCDCDPHESIVPSIDRAVTQLLLNLEPYLINELSSDPETGFKSVEFYELFTVHLELDAEFKPHILKVEDLKQVDTIPVQILNDTLNVILAHALPEDFLSTELDSIPKDLKVGILGIDCWIHHELCLTRGDIVHILRSRLERLQMGGFRRIYPNFGVKNFFSTQTHFSRSRETSRSLSASPGTDGHPRTNPAKALSREGIGHTTEDLHPILSSLEAHYLKNDESNSNFQNMDRNQSDCLLDEDAAMYLESITFDPPLDLSPPFSSGWREYTVFVPYDTVIVQISAIPRHCHREVKFQQVSGPKRAINLTLGLGVTKLPLLVVDSHDREGTRRKSEDQDENEERERERDTIVVNSYSLTFRRDRVQGGEPPFIAADPHQVCALKQECSYLIDSEEPCGMQPEMHGDDLFAWKDHLFKTETLPKCTSGDEPGRWLLPCSNKSCDICWWSQAAWQPYRCSYHTNPSEYQVARCLDNKKLLFLGDSTNRGMMQRIFELFDDALLTNEKTHDIKVYGRGLSPRHPDVNVSFSFGYYPQFWVVASQRPRFEKTLSRLLVRSWPLSNSSSTILVIGGVHWLASHHIHTLYKVLEREGLTGIKVIVKTLGSGFHIPSAGVHYLSKKEQEKLMVHSRGLAQLARHYRMSILDTYNMTAARYKDFLQGSCACHFHQVQENEDQSRFRMIGQVNNIYADILLSLICPLSPNAA